MDLLQAEDTPAEELIKTLKREEQVRAEIIEGFTTKVDGECQEFARQF